MLVDGRTVMEAKRRYPAGTRVVVERMGDDPRPVEPGTVGTVIHVDDIGTVHCVFEDGRSLGLIPGEDAFRVLRAPGREER